MIHLMVKDYDSSGLVFETISTIIPSEGDLITFGDKTMSVKFLKFHFQSVSHPTIKHYADLIAVEIFI